MSHEEENMKKMSMAQAMSKAIEKVDSLSNLEVTKAYPLEGSGNKENGYDYLLIGVESYLQCEERQYNGYYEVAVHCNEMTGWKPEIGTIVARSED